MVNFISMLPQEAINMSYEESLQLLETLVNKNSLTQAFDINKTFPSPVSDEISTDWFKKSNIIGINPRITKTYWGIVKYAMTFPENAIHLLPLFEAGCDNAIYAPVSWNLSYEFLDPELVKIGYETPEKQLKLIINVLHCLGKTVGFDALTHCDKFAEFVFVNPKHFEWVKLNKERTSQLFPPAINYNTIYLEVENAIKDFLKINGSADNSIKIDDNLLNNFFSDDFAEQQRLNILFGFDADCRLKRRVELLNFIRKNGFETVPVTEHAPCRPIIFDCMKKDEDVEWAEFKVDNSSPISKIFGSQTPFKLYPIENEGYPETDKPYFEMWDYLAIKFFEFQNEYNFDFLRADMAHNQPSHSQKNETKLHFNKHEIWAFIKERIRHEKPYFATLAEAFLNQHYYIDGFQDMENKKFDLVLGPLNFLYLNDEYVSSLQCLSTMDYKYRFKTCVTSITNDTDRESNNNLYKSPFSNELRLFTGLFTDLPSYMGIGLETRDYDPISKEYFSNHYTNYQPIEYQWGNNVELFGNISGIRQIFSKIYPHIKDQKLCWLNTDNPYQASWLYINQKTNQPSYLFSINLDISNDYSDVNIDNFADCANSANKYKLETVFAMSDVQSDIQIIEVNDENIKLENFSIGEARIYRIRCLENSFASKNPKTKQNHILIVSPECDPYSKQGGLGDINRDFSRAFKEAYSDKDLRIILPLYNANDDGPKNINGKYYLEIYDANEESSNKSFEIINTGIKTNFSYGINQSSAELYKIKSPENNVPTYVVYSPAFSNEIEAYSGKYYNICKNYIAFSAAVLALLKKLSESKEESFSPQILHLTDWTTSFVQYFINKNAKSDSFYKEIETLFVIHNNGINYQGCMLALFVLVNLLDKSESDKIINSDILKKNLKETYNVDFNQLVEESKNNFEFLSENEKYQDIISYINKYIRENLSNYSLDKFDYFNPVEYAILNCNKWFTDSYSFYQEITSSIDYATPNLFYSLSKTQNKGDGILCGLDPERYLPSDAGKIEYTYNSLTFAELKTKNKLFLQEAFSGKNVNNLCFNKKFVNDKRFLKVNGYLKSDKNAPVLFVCSRFDMLQKGTDIIINLSEKLLRENEDIQLIMCIQNTFNALKNKNPLLERFLSKVINNPNFGGRVLLVDNFVPVSNYLAATDIFIMPSRYEPCGMMQFQAMRFGTVPVVSNTGGLRDSIIEINEGNQTGFKTDVPLMETYNPEIELLKTLNRTLLQFKNKNNWNEIVKNCMNYNSSWNNQKLSKFYNIYSDLCNPINPKASDKV